MSAVSGNYSHRVIGTIFLISFGIYLFLATATYTPFDPGWMHVSSDTREVSNASGISGAWFADLLYGLFGWAALLLPLFIFLEAIQLWWPRSYLTLVFRYAAQFFILLTSAALLYFFWQVPGKTLVNASGGIIGYEIANSLGGLLSSFGAIVFLLAFWFTLWTLAFKIEWLKTPALLRSIPHYLQDLFYKNVPPEAEDFDLTMSKTSSALKHSHEHKIEEHTEAQQTQNELTLTSEEEEKIRQLDAKIVTQPKLQKTVDEKVSIHDLTQQVVQTGDVWHPQTTTTLGGKHVEPLHAQASHHDVLGQQSVQDQVHVEVKASVASQRSNSDAQPYRNERAETDLSDLIEEADRQLQASQPVQKNEQVLDRQEYQSKTSKENVLDWSDDEIFDELLAAVPITSQQPTVSQQHATLQQPSAQQQSTPRDDVAIPVGMDVKPTQINDLKDLNIDDFNDLDALFNEPQPNKHVDSEAKVEQQHQYTDVQRPQASPVNKAPQELSKEEFIEAWHETAGKPEEFDWDDLDAPLTDAAGRPVSRAMQVAAHRKTLSRLPSLDILDPVDLNKKINFTAEQLARLSDLLELKLQDFNVKAKVIEAHPGPVVTRFELDLAPGVKASKVTNISRDLARSMSMASVRVVEVIPGKPYIGIEVPNSSREMVRLIELLDTPAYRDPSALLSMAMGKDISGNPVLADLAKAPHMLVAGTTGSGKSVAVNAMLLSMLLKYTPEDLRLIMIDPKQLELANYNDIPHLLTPVVTDMKDAVNALNWCVNEMERRYKLMSLLKVRKLTDFNRKVRESIENGEDLIDPTWKPDDSATQSRAPRLQEMPLIVIVADEFADMIMQVGKKAEEMITRLAQKSRAAGIHLLLATQRPTVDVVTGLIKANIPTRAALRVNSKIDSRTILDAGGAEDLLGHGDMLFLGPGKIEPERVHGAFISDDEVNRICDAWRERGSPNYVDEILTPYDEDGSSNSSGGDYESGDNSDRDMLYDQCVAFVLETRKATASSLQRKFSLGYNRAARIIDQMEENGVVSPLGANGKRDIIV